MERKRPGKEARPPQISPASDSLYTTNIVACDQGEVAVMKAGPRCWWVHIWDQHHDSGALLSSHPTKRKAFIAAHVAGREMGVPVTVWGDG